MPSREEKSGLPKNLALEKAAKFCAKRTRFEAEVRLHLQEFDADQVESAIQVMMKMGAVNDDRALQEFIDHHRGKHLLAPRFMVEELAKRGFVCDEQNLPRPSTQDLVDALIARRFSASDPPKVQARAVRWLASRGFEEDEIEFTLIELLVVKEPS